jgi:glycosyltransferase involved in cell wall biosynthesis
MTGLIGDHTSELVDDTSNRNPAGGPGGADGPPLVSIGLPVYNGEQYLSASIDSLLDQTYANIELIICDNASDDRTQEICEKYAANDARVRYHRNEHNIGGARNHNLTFTLARGKYFRWAAHDDLAEPELIERCVEVLEAHPEVVLCHTDFVHIDAAGAITGHISRNHCGAPHAAERFASMAEARDFCEETYGLIRAEIFAQTDLQMDYTGSDRTLMCELALHGRFENVEQCLFSKRLHGANEYIDWRTRMAWFGEEYKGRIAFPWWTQLADYLRVIRRVPLTSRDRRRCHLYMARWIATHSPKLTKDVLVATMMAFRTRSRRLSQFSATENWS